MNKEPWCTEEIGVLIDKRLAAKNTNQYSIIHKEIQWKCKEEKEGWMNKQCTEIEESKQKHDHCYLHIRSGLLPVLKDFQTLGAPQWIQLKKQLL